MVHDVEVVPTTPAMILIEGRSYTADEAISLIDAITGAVVQAIQLNSREPS